MSNTDEALLISKTGTEGVKQSIKWFPWIVCGLGAVFYAYEYFLRISPSVMTIELMQSFKINAESFGNLVAFYYYAYAPAQIFVGILMDRYGPRRVLTIACLLCAIGSYLFASTGSLFVASAGRFMVGFGSAFAFVGVLKLATIWLPPNRFAMITGLTAALGTVGAMFGEIILTSFVEAMGWRASVLISAALGVILAIVLLVFVRDGSKEAQDLDSQQAVDFKSIFAGLGKIATNPLIWINGLIGCLLYLPTTAFAELWANPFFQTTFSFSGQEAAWAVSAIFLGFTIGGPINGWISDKIESRRLPMLCGGILAAATISIILYVPNLSQQLIFFLLFLFGIFYSVQVIVFAVGREISPINTAGTALAVTNGLVMLGGVVFQPVIGSILEWKWSGEIINHIHVYTASDYKFAMGVLPASILAGAILVLFLKETHCQVIERDK